MSSIALEDADGLAVGVVHDPISGETFRAVRGEGAFLGERAAAGARRRARSSRRWWPPGSATSRERRAVQADVIRELLPRARDIRRAGAAALDLAWLAAGRVDAFFERGLKRWDWAAGRLLVEEAGGAVEWLEDDWPGMVAASSPELLAELRAFL